MFRKVLAALIAASFVILGTASGAKAETTLKFATLAPKRSPWGKVFTTWTKAVDQKTNGEVKVDWLWNGRGGPENGVVGKIRSGNIAGAAITAVGLGAIDKRFAALQMPGAFKSWAELDKARETLAKDIVNDDKFKKEFHLGGFGDVGIGHVMSKGFEVKVPNDLKGKHPGMITEDIISPKVYEAIGGVTPVPSPVTGFLPKLSSGAIDVMNTPALAAEQLQWAPRLDNMNSADTYFGIGAVVISQKALDGLTKDQREVLTSTGKQAADALTSRIRKADAEAYERLKKKMTVHESTGAEKAEWATVFKKACTNLKAVIPGDALGKIGAC
jgi:TRAP-type C4-dicarboxylate transport system substrate-binding protein